MNQSIGPQHERYAAWLERRGGSRNRQDETALLAIADAYDAATQSGTLSASQLQLVVDGASSPHALLWNNAVDLLMRLSARWPEAAEAILAMSHHRQAQVRFAAICALGKETPVAIVDTILRAGLLDKSSRVRWKAADRASRLERVNLVPEITTALAAEANTKARCSIEFDLRMLRDGYWVEPAENGYTHVTARTSNGISSRGVSDEEFQSKGLDRILAELRE